jgi:hypothetical protein
MMQVPFPNPSSWSIIFTFIIPESSTLPADALGWFISDTSNFWSSERYTVTLKKLVVSIDTYKNTIGKIQDSDGILAVAYPNYEWVRFYFHSEIKPNYIVEIGYLTFS